LHLGLWVGLRLCWCQCVGAWGALFVQAHGHGLAFHGASIKLAGLQKHGLAAWQLVCKTFLAFKSCACSCNGSLPMQKGLGKPSSWVYYIENNSHLQRTFKHFAN
jgi:hypothetical protein